MLGRRLSHQGRASLRFFVNRVAARAGFIYLATPNVEIRGESRRRDASICLARCLSLKQVINTDTQQQETHPSNSARGTAFEHHILDLLRKAYPQYAWYDQGRDKRLERGLDFVGTRIGDIRNESRSIGAQVKFHQPNSTTRLWNIRLLPHL
jgi:hypothetical protein